MQQAEQARDQSLARRAAKAVIIRALNTGIGNKKKPRTDLVGGVCRVRAFMPGCNTVMDRSEWSLSHTRFFVFFRSCK